MENKQELKACWWCGGNATVTCWPTLSRITCQGCGRHIAFHGPESAAQTKKGIPWTDIKEQWNHRPIEDQLKADLGEMVDLYILLTDFVAIDTVLDMFPPEHQDRACKIYDGIAKAVALKTKWGI